MICLTGDLHHMTLGTGNQAHADDTEIRIASRYLDRLREARVKVTFFVSGKSFEEEWSDLRSIAHDELVELGGHNYRCFTPPLWHRVWNKVLKSYPGPAWYERIDIARTIDIAKKRSGRRIRAWRDHMYMHGPNTDRLLAEAGIRVCSDRVRKFGVPVRDSLGVVHVPINVIPDHEHIFHAERTREWVAWWLRRYNFKDEFTRESFTIEAWADFVIENLRENEARGITSTLIIHPITMYLSDRFRSFERILEFIAARETTHISALAASLPERALPILGQKVVLERHEARK